MKKRIGIILCFVFLFSLAGCADERAAVRNVNQAPSVNDVLEAGMAAEDQKKEASTELPADTQETAELPADTQETAGSSRRTGVDENAPEPEPMDESNVPVSTSDGIDVDLTTLSSTMVYAEVYNMMVQPQDYIGKTVKMDGLFSFYHDETTGKDYFACIIQDATACCSQGIEFVLTEDYTYPDDYPEVGGEICVCGVFDTYQEGEYTYCTLRDATLS